MKLISPWRYSSTFFERCFAIALKPICSNRRPSAAGSGAAYSTNSKPSVPSGLSQSEGVAVAMFASELRETRSQRQSIASACER